MRIGRWLFSLCALPRLLCPADTAGPAPAAVFEKSVRPFLAKNCYACHNSKLMSGGLSLESYKTAESALEDRDLWSRLLRRVEAGEMPPRGLPRPDAEELRAVTEWIKSALGGASAAGQASESGHVTARRLNRTEYNNTVRDLLGVDIDAASDFPQDDAVYGFDNIANALTVSPLLMEKYLAAAEKIARLAVFGPELKPFTLRFTPPIPRRMEGANPIQITSPPPFSMTDYDPTGVSMQGAYHLMYKFPADGEYLFRVFTTGSRPAGSEPQALDLWIDGKIVKSFEVQDLVTVTNEKMPSGLELRWKLTAGPHQLIAAYPRVFEGLPANYNGPNPSKKTVPARDTSRFFPPLPANATPEQIAARRAAQERFQSRVAKFDGLAVSELEILGPFDYRKAPSAESLRKVYACGHLDGHHVAGCERKILSSLAARAYRRPATPDETQELVSVFSDARKRGRSFEQGIALAVETVLVSPDFLFRIEKETGAKSAANTLQPIGQYELASRLSYFLWSTMPDDELMNCARAGTLRKPEVLEAEVRRMLKDPRASALAENFAGQWLEVRGLEAVQPDRDRFPDFDDYLRYSMLQETQSFFQNVMRQDRPVLDFIDGKYTFVNERLARHYGIAGVKGPEFRRVELSDARRGGILTQASVLTVSSYGNRTSPVRRGKWILENLLNTPPPPPPPNVPNLDEAAVGTTASMRQQLEQHRKDPACATCHVRMDPLGFALENYDAVGLWRTEDGKFPIDAAAALPDGKPFQGAEGLKAILLGDKDGFTKCLVEKMLIYALGRGVESFDQGAIRRISGDAAAHQYRFSSVVLGIVNSAAFQTQGGKS